MYLGYVRDLLYVKIYSPVSVSVDMVGLNVFVGRKPGLLKRLRGKVFLRNRSGLYLGVPFRQEMGEFCPFLLPVKTSKVVGRLSLTS